MLPLRGAMTDYIDETVNYHQLYRVLTILLRQHNNKLYSNADTYTVILILSH